MRAEPHWRVASPAGGSILMTSAPKSPSNIEQAGPAPFAVKSITVMSSSGAAISFHLDVVVSDQPAPARALLAHDPGKLGRFLNPRSEGHFRDLPDHFLLGHDRLDYIEQRVHDVARHVGRAEDPVPRSIGYR